MEKANEAYLTKRVVERATKRGVRKAARETMDVMGYIVIAKDGWIVRQDADGHIERLHPLESPDHSGPLKLD